MRYQEQSTHMPRSSLSDRLWLMQSGAVRAITHDEVMARLRDERELVSSPEAAYARVVWVYRCVQLRAQLIGAMPYTILDAAGREVAFPDMPWLLRHIEFALCLWGAAYLLKAKRNVLQWLNPQTVTVEADASGLKGFRQSVGGRVQRYQPDEIVYLALFHPSDDLGPGVAPAQACLDAAGLASAANLYAQSYFRNGAVPAVLLTTEMPLPEAEQNRLREAWERLFGGVRKAHRTAVMPPGIRPTVIGSSAKDAVLTPLLTEARQQIAVAFGIPQTLLEDAANFATAREHKLSLYRETIIPEAEFIRDGLNEQYFAPQGLELVFHYEQIEALQQDEASKAQQIAALVDRGIMSVAEAREQLGLKVKEQPAATSTEPLDAQRGLSGEVRAELARWRRKAKRGKTEFDSDVLPAWIMRAVRWRLEHVPGEDPLGAWLKAFDQGGAEQQVARAVREVLEAARPKVVARVARGEMPDEEIEGLREDLTQTLVPLLTNIVVDALTATAAEAGIELPLDEVLSDAAEWAAQYTYDLVRGISETERDICQKVVSQLANGQIDREGAEAMLEPIFGKVRAGMIAATEVTRATSQATLMYQRALEAQGLESVRRWLTAEDERVCPVCGALDHKTEDVWAAEYPDGPPAHVNCRCVAVLEWPRRR